VPPKLLRLYKSPRWILRGIRSDAAKEVKSVNERYRALESDSESVKQSVITTAIRR